jgi:hypothetical protein
MWLYVTEKYPDGSKKSWFLKPVSMYYNENELYVMVCDGSYCLFQWENVEEFLIIGDNLVTSFASAKLSNFIK